MSIQKELFYKRLSAIFIAILVSLYLTSGISGGIGTAFNELLLKAFPMTLNQEYNLSFMVNMYSWMWSNACMPALDFTTWYLIGLLPYGLYMTVDKFNVTKRNKITGLDNVIHHI